MTQPPNLPIAKLAPPLPIATRAPPPLPEWMTDDMSLDAEDAPQAKPTAPPPIEPPKAKPFKLPPPDPAIFADYRVAKRAAAILARELGATLLQNLKGKPRIIIGARSQDCPTWASAWSWLYRIYCDQRQAKS